MTQMHSRPVWLRHEASLAHDVPGHPERPDRLRAIEYAMGQRDWVGFETREAPRADRATLEAVHPAKYLDSIEALCERGGGAIDLDTSCVPATWEAALRAAGGACAMVDALLGGEAPFGFSALRPPGHHAETARSMGFCFVNNVAVAARHAREAHGVERTLVFDWDVHHGNGTEDIFWSDPSVAFVSVHQWPLYPGTGATCDAGVGPGEGYTLNIPVPAGTGDWAYVSIARDVLAPMIRGWEPGLVLVSAGFDAHHLDPLADCRVTEKGFADMTAALRAACAGLCPLGFVLEGGYSLEALSASITAVAGELSADSSREVEPGELHPIAEEARNRAEVYGLTSRT